MSTYQLMHDKYLVWTKIKSEYDEKATASVIKFISGLRVYLQMDKGYAQAMQVTKINHNIDGWQRYTAADGFRQALSKDSDGILHFGIEIIFSSEAGFAKLKIGDQERTSTSGSQVYLFYDIRMEIQEGAFLFSNALDPNSPRIACKFTDGVELLDPLYSSMAAALASVFDRRPWHGYKKIPMGFEVSPQPTP